MKVNFPAEKPCDFCYALKITGLKIASAGANPARPLPGRPKCHCPVSNSRFHHYENSIHTPQVLENFRAGRRRRFHRPALDARRLRPRGVVHHHRHRTPPRHRAVQADLGIACQRITSARMVPRRQVRHLGALDGAMRPRAGRLVCAQNVHPGRADYDYHVKTYGHPSKFGFMEIDNLWKAEKWEPEKLMALYKRAGAKYFFALANHHDNFDCLRLQVSRLEFRQGRPQERHRRHLGASVARANGLRFGVTNHDSWAARWLQPAYGYDGEGPLAGVRYDAYTLTKADGKGKWWEGLDPQDLYTGQLRGDARRHSRARRPCRPGSTPTPAWPRATPCPPRRSCENWFLRCQDLVDKYQPDVLYFDTNELPLEQAGLDVVSHYYNRSAARNGGKADVVVNGKHILPAAHRRVRRGHRAQHRQRHPPRSVADRHLHRRLALQPRRRRGESLRDRRHALSPCSPTS